MTEEHVIDDPEQAFQVLQFKLEEFAGSLPHAWGQYPVSVVSEWTPDGWTEATLEHVLPDEQRERLRATAGRLRKLLPGLKGRFQDGPLDELDQRLVEAIGLLCREDTDAARRAETLANDIRESLGTLPLNADDAPRWNADTGCLCFRGQVVRNVSGQATNLRKVLDAFQEQAWQTRIDDPLPGGKDQARVNETVKSLNQGCTAIHFSADGTGAGYRWSKAE